MISSASALCPAWSSFSVSVCAAPVSPPLQRLLLFCSRSSAGSLHVSYRSGLSIIAAVAFRWLCCCYSLVCFCVSPRLRQEVCRRSSASGSTICACPWSLCAIARATLLFSARVAGFACAMVVELLSDLLSGAVAGCFCVCERGTIGGEKAQRRRRRRRERVGRCCSLLPALCLAAVAAAASEARR